MILIDGHVHIYDCFKVTLLLEAAYANFSAEAHRQKKNDAFLGILLLTETSKDKWYNRLSHLHDNSASSDDATVSKWSFTRQIEENCSLLAHGDAGKSVVLIAGKQIVTSEGIEVLAIATNKTFEDGMQLQDVLRVVQENNAIPVLPWGVGKWWGKRGKLIKNVLMSNHFKGIFLGDIAGRPTFWPQPSLFSIAHSMGVKVLPGTDPLPLPSETIIPGSYGFLMNASISLSNPATELKMLLQNPNVNLKIYGQRSSIYRFLSNQILIRMQ
jgi:hypothetical protein